MRNGGDQGVGCLVVGGPVDVGGVDHVHDEGLVDVVLPTEGVSCTIGQICSTLVPLM